MDRPLRRSMLGAALCCAALHFAYAKAGKGAKTREQRGRTKGWADDIRKALAAKMGSDQHMLDWGGRPDHVKIIAALKRAADKNDRAKAVDKVVTAYWRWPGAWNHYFYDLLDPSRPWMEDYCRRLSDNELWSPAGASFAHFALPLAPLRYFRAQADMIDRFRPWLDAADDTMDSAQKQFVEAVHATSKEKMVANGPFHRLAEYQHGKMLQHLLKVACKDFPNASVLLDRRDGKGQTLLHHASKNGKTELVKVLMLLKNREDRADYAAIKDSDGHRAEDLARFTHLEATADAIVELSGQAAKSTYAGQLRTMFRPPLNVSEEEVANANNSGGWDTRLRDDLVPLEWLPNECFADVIEASQFDWEVFNKSYIQHKRPLLIRNVQPREPHFYTKKGLLETAGKLKVKDQPVPYGQEKAKGKKLSSYVKHLAKRKNPALDLSYIFIGPVQASERKLEPARKVPDILKDTPWGDRSDHITQFFLGGVLMGSQPHFHHPAMNLLAHGTKLWLMRPWPDPVWGQIPAYDYMVTTNGAPEAMKCMQRAGDLLFVPEMWTHAVVCVSDCIGAAYEYEDKNKGEGGLSATGTLDDTLMGKDTKAERSGETGKNPLEGLLGKNPLEGLLQDTKLDMDMAGALDMDAMLKELQTNMKSSMPDLGLEGMAPPDLSDLGGNALDTSADPDDERLFEL